MHGQQNQGGDKDRNKAGNTVSSGLTSSESGNIGGADPVSPDSGGTGGENDSKPPGPKDTDNGADNNANTDDKETLVGDNMQPLEAPLPSGLLLAGILAAIAALCAAMILLLAWHRKKRNTKQQA
jgi:hypothetical protein